MIRPYSTNDGRVPAWEYYPADGLTPKVGMALKLANGKLVLSTGGTAPQFICMRDEESALPAGALPIPVIAVNDGIIFEAKTAATLALGATCAIGDDGLSVVSGSGDGVVVGTTEAGVLVRFK